MAYKEIKVNINQRTSIPNIEENKTELWKI